MRGKKAAEQNQAELSSENTAEKEISPSKESAASKKETPANEPKPRKKRGIATPDDVLRFFTEIMNGDDDIKDRMKAAEFLGKRYGLFKDAGEAEEGKCLVIVGEDKL